MVLPELDRGTLPGLVLPVVVLALELSGHPSQAGLLRVQARDLADRLLSTLPTAALGGTLSDGVLAAIVTTDSLADSACLAASGTTVLGRSDSLEWRAGLAAGLVDGSEPWSAEVVKRAAALARAAQPGQTLASYSVARLLDRDWQFAPAGALPRRPGGDTESATALLGRKQPAPTPSALAPDRTSEMVGRERELAVLDRELARARDGETRWCAIVAPAGGGKSRLLRVWLGDHEDTRVRTIGAAASPFGQAPRALVDQLLGALGTPLAPEAAPVEVVSMLAEALERQGRDELFRIVIDDLHWADAESLEVLSALVSLPLRSCLFVIALRSSFYSQASWLLQRAQCIELPPLDQDERRTLLRHLLPGKANARLHAELASADQGGNPLYLEHAAAYLDEAGPGAAPPRSLHEAVLARLAIIRTRIDRVGYERPSPADLAAIEQTVGEWLDRLETGDYDDRVTIAQYLSLLERIDVGLVIAGNIAGVPQRRNRRLAAAVDRFYTTSFEERAEAIERLARHDKANAAWAAARGAQQATAAVRLDDATRFLELGARLTHGEEQGGHLLTLGDLRFERGDPDGASSAYADAAGANANDLFRARVERRLARIALSRGDPLTARRLLDRALPRLDERERIVASCDLVYAHALLGEHRHARATLKGLEDHPARPEMRALLSRTFLRLAALDRRPDAADTARRCASSLVLEDDAVGDLSALLDTTLLLCQITPDHVAPSLIVEARRAAQRLGNGPPRDPHDSGTNSGQRLELDSFGP